MIRQWRLTGLTYRDLYIKYCMIKMAKPVFFAAIAGILGIFLAAFGFFRTLLIIVLVILGFLIGSYWETKKNKEP
jgi:uncharacterized membrane protein